MTRPESVPAPAVRRLSLYLRRLEALDAGNDRTVSSKQLGQALSLSDAQVRKDLAYFGQFGQPGVGYRVSELIQRVRHILGTDKRTNALLVGVGNLGRALLSFRGFERRGFDIVAAFDNDPKKIGTLFRRGDRRLEVQPLNEIGATTRAQQIRIGVLCVPAPAAPAVADAMIEAGIRGLLNFAPVPLPHPSDIAVSSVDLAIHLELLSFHLNNVGASRTV